MMNSNLFRAFVVVALGIAILLSPVGTYSLSVYGSGGVHVTVSPTSNSVPRGGTVVFTVSIKGPGTDHIAWGASVTGPSPTTNAPVIHQSTYHVIGSGSPQFTATAGNQTSLITWTITVTAVDATHCCGSDSAKATLTVTDFSVTSSPASVTVLAGQTATSTITTSGQNGFAGTIYLSFDQPSYLCNLQPSSITLSGSSPSANSILSCTFPKGSFTVTITGTQFVGTPSRTATVTIVVN